MEVGTWRPPNYLENNSCDMLKMGYGSLMSTQIRIEDSFEVRHLHDWYSRQFPIDHIEASQASLDYLASLEDHEQENVISDGWLKLAISLNHYGLYR